MPVACLVLFRLFASLVRPSTCRQWEIASEIFFRPHHLFSRCPLRFLASGKTVFTAHGSLLLGGLPVNLTTDQSPFEGGATALLPFLVFPPDL